MYLKKHCGLIDGTIFWPNSIYLIVSLYWSGEVKTTQVQSLVWFFWILFYNQSHQTISKFSSENLQKLIDCKTSIDRYIYFIIVRASEASNMERWVWSKESNLRGSVLFKQHEVILRLTFIDFFKFFLFFARSTSNTPHTFYLKQNIHFVSIFVHWPVSLV